MHQPSQSTLWTWATRWTSPKLKSLIGWWFLQENPEQYAYNVCTYCTSKPICTSKECHNFIYNVSQMGSARLHNAIITSNSEHYQMSCSLGIPHCTRCSAGYEGLLCLLEEGKSYNIFVQAQLAMQHGLYDIYRCDAHWGLHQWIVMKSSPRSDVQ